jgi:hypothetical protein
VIPDEAVEAAAQRIAELRADGAKAAMWRTDDIAALLEAVAAAPHLMAAAFDQGQKSGMRHVDRLVAAARIGREDLPGPLSPNPYRKPCKGCPDCQGIPHPRPCTGTAWTGDRQCILDAGHGGLCK